MNNLKEINFSARLKDLRKNKKLSQTELANFLGITQANVSRYEKGDQLPDFDTLVKLSQKFDVSLDDLVFSTGFTKEELQFIDSTKKISAEELLNDYELVVDGVAATDKEIEEAIRMIKFNRFQS
ncbi:helix-turn-helix domain-containing protein [Kurthia senegalensis]|uniref:helix-turn-helix domain-containing protein n=1 Tax=Kurthia senegalensis TaxID=1033740 RepID=UPI00028812A8|nr:helix-turn-helix transcriptional regulator [Kurthia senegalensis]